MAMTGEDAGGQAAEASPLAPPVPRAAFDVIRLLYASGAGATTAGITALAVALSGHVSTGLIVTCLFAFSAGWSIAYLVHTLHLFGRMDPPTLRAALLGSNPRGRFGRVGAILSGTGPTAAVQWSFIAVAAVLTFTVWPGLLREPVTVVFSILVVAASWVVTLVAYGLHYARFDAQNKGLQFPDKKHGRLFIDYLYLSVQVQTTFSTSDVSLVSPQARSLVTGHTLVSFAFNTVIIAMLITVLFLGH
jgi:uncharacterized membrane protein